MTKPVALLDTNVFPPIWLLRLTDFAEDVEVTSCRACWPLTQRPTTVTGYTYEVGQPRWVKVRAEHPEYLRGRLSRYASNFCRYLAYVWQISGFARMYFAYIWQSVFETGQLGGSFIPFNCGFSGMICHI